MAAPTAQHDRPTAAAPLASLRRTHAAGTRQPVSAHGESPLLLLGDSEIWLWPICGDATRRRDD